MATLTKRGEGVVLGNRAPEVSFDAERIPIWGPGTLSFP
jgi:hypothetical protein